MNPKWSAPVDGDLFIAAHQAVTKRRDEKGEPLDYMEAILAVRGALEEASAGEAGDVLVAIMFRIDAFRAAMQDARAAKWSLSVGSDDFILTAGPMFRAAARATLDLSGHDPRFDIDELLALALQFSEEHGQA